MSRHKAKRKTRKRSVKARAASRSSRKSRRRARRARRSKSRVRSVVVVSGGAPARRKGRRRRSNPSSALSMRSVKSFFTARNVTHFLSIGGGIFLGTLVSRFLNTGALPFMAPPAATPAWVATVQKARPVHGFIHIVLGTYMTRKSRSPYLKDAGMGLAALGGFDLLSQVLSLAGMRGLPTFSGMNVNLLGMNYNAPAMAGRPGPGIPSPFSGGTSMNDSLAEALAG